MAAQEALADLEARAAFAQSFLRCEALFELLWPDTRLRPVEDDYRWLARVYTSVHPSVDANVLLWHRLGEKTRAIIGEHVGGVTVDQAEPRPSPSTPSTFEALRQLTDLRRPPRPVVAADRRGGARHARQAPEAQVGRARLTRSGVLVERLEALRQAQVTGASSVDFLKRILELARALVEAERPTPRGARRDERPPTRTRAPSRRSSPSTLRRRPGDHREGRRGASTRSSGQYEAPAGRPASPATAKSAASYGSYSPTTGPRRRRPLRPRIRLHPRALSVTRANPREKS